MPPKAALPKTALPSCGFSVTATKKGELPLKVEKRARGKKVTIIPNVLGDGAKLARALMGMLGVGGTVRRVEGGFQAVEVQGDQTARLTQVLLDFGCLQGLTKAALDVLKKDRAPGTKGELVVDRNATSKFLAQAAKLSPQEERRRALEQEAEFYGVFWQAIAVPPGAVDDFSDIWEETLSDDRRAEVREREGPGTGEQDVTALNMGLKVLGMFAEVGRAVKEFWDTNSGMTVTQFRKMALNPGARLIDEGPGRKIVPSNLKSRQKISDWKSGRGGSHGGHYFSVSCKAIDDYERGIAPSKEEEPQKPQEPEMKVEVDQDGWNTAVLSYCVPLVVPSSRLEDEERAVVSKRALRELEVELGGDLDQGVREKVPGVECRLDCSLFGVDLHVREQGFLHAGRRDNGKAPDQQDKEEMKLEKKLREICALRKRQVDGEKLEKLQVDKLSRKGELFREVADLKLRRAEKELLRVFKRYKQRFQDAFFDMEWKALYGGESSNEEHHQPGTFDVSSCQGTLEVSRDGFHAESSSATWTGCCLHLRVRNGEVGAFAIEVLQGIVRLGWAASASSTADLGADGRSWGFGATGKKVTGGTFEPYGQPFTAGDLIHCEAEREEGRLRIGYAKNNEPLGVAFDTADELGQEALAGAVSGKAFKVRLVSAESMPLDEAPGLDNFREFDPPRQVLVIKDFVDDSEESDGSILHLQTGEMLYVSSDDGEGWLLGFYLDPDDPEDGGWFPANCVQFIDEEEQEDGDVDADAPRQAPQTAEAEAWDVSESAAADEEDWVDAAPAYEEALEEERRIDPEDGEARTLRQMRAFYAGQYTHQEIAEHWEICEPAGMACAAPARTERDTSVVAGDSRHPAARGGAPDKATQQKPEEVRVQNGHVKTTAPAQTPAPQRSHARQSGVVAATARSKASSEVAAVDLSEIQGLEEWLASLHLLRYAEKALHWCEEMGAVDVNEVKEYWEDFAEALGLTKIERKRMAKNMAS